MTERYFDTDGHFIHPCTVCSRDAGYGFDVSLHTGRMGRWFCAKHQTAFEPKPAPPRPDVIIPDDILAMTLPQIQAELRNGTDGGAGRRMALWRHLDQVIALQQGDDRDLCRNVHR